MVRTSYASTIRKRPRPKQHKFYPFVSRSHDGCEHSEYCNDCMDGFAEQAERDRPGHIWAVDKGKVIYLEDVVACHHLGRELKPTETVIHKNADPKDNRFENLEVITIPDMEKP
jgi:hypothetical protein